MKEIEKWPVRLSDRPVGSMGWAIDVARGLTRSASEVRRWRLRNTAAARNAADRARELADGKGYWVYDGEVFCYMVREVTRVPRLVLEVVPTVVWSAKEGGAKKVKE